MARCSDCLYYGHINDFYGKGCPKCSGVAILVGESKTFEEKLSWIIGASTTIIVILLLLVSFFSIEKSLSGLPQQSNDLFNPFYSWHFLLSVVIGVLVGAFIGFRFEARRKIRQKAREVLARNKKRGLLDATVGSAGAIEYFPLHALTESSIQEEKNFKNLIEDNNGNVLTFSIKPIGMLHGKRIRKVKAVIKELLNRLPIIEHEIITECRQKMINQPGSTHSSMFKGSLEKVVEFVIRMIRETENYILTAEGIIKLDKVLLISDWPVGKPVLEIQYEQFWNNNTFNIYSEHVMRIDNDLFEVFGSKKSYDRMKLV